MSLRMMHTGKRSIIQSPSRLNLRMCAKIHQTPVPLEYSCFRFETVRLHLLHFLFSSLRRGCAGVFFHQPRVNNPGHGGFTHLLPSHPLL